MAESGNRIFVAGWLCPDEMDDSVSAGVDMFRSNDSRIREGGEAVLRSLDEWPMPELIELGGRVVTDCRTLTVQQLRKIVEENKKSKCKDMCVLESAKAQFGKAA